MNLKGNHTWPQFEAVKTGLQEVELRANVLGFRIVNVWNSLPEDVVNASSVNAFKRLFDRHCVQKRFMSDV